MPNAPIGSDLQVGFGLESADNVHQGYNGTAGITKFVRPMSISGYRADRPLVSVENLDPSGQDLLGRNEQAPINTKWSFQPDVDSLPWLLTHFTSFHDTITNPAYGAFTWPIRPIEKTDTFAGSGGVTYVDSYSQEVDINDGQPVLTIGNRISEIGLKISEGKLTQMDITSMGCAETSLGDVEEVAVNAAMTGSVVIRGMRVDQETTDALKFKISAAAGAGYVGKMKGTSGATPYGSFETTIVNFDEWTRIYLADGSESGVEVMFTDPLGTSVLTVADEWTVDATRTIATPTYSTKNVLGAARTYFRIGGVLYPAHALDIKLTRPRKAAFGLSSVFAQTIQRNGRFGCSISVDRDANDLTFVKKLYTAGTVGIVVQCDGDHIADNIYEQLLLTITAAQVQKADRNVSTPNVLPEKIDLKAGRSGSNPIFNVALTCGVSTLADDDMIS